jgi:hypothetical protein
MTLHLALMIIVLGCVAVALTVNVAAVVGFLRRWKQ